MHSLKLQGSAVRYSQGFTYRAFIIPCPCSMLCAWGRLFFPCCVLR